MVGVERGQVVELLLLLLRRETPCDQAADPGCDSTHDVRGASRRPVALLRPGGDQAEQVSVGVAQHGLSLAPRLVRGWLHDRGDARRGGSSGGLVHVWHGEAHRYARAAGGRGALV